MNIDLEKLEKAMILAKKHGVSEFTIDGTVVKFPPQYSSNLPAKPISKSSSDEDEEKPALTADQVDAALYTSLRG